MAMQQIIVDDPAAQARTIQPDDFALGLKVAGAPGDAISMDSWRALLETSLRAVLTGIIQADAPSGIRITGFSLVNTTTIRLEYAILGHTAQLDVPLASLFRVAAPENIAINPAAGDTLDYPRGNHAHALPSRAVPGQTPIVTLVHIANAPPASYGFQLGFNATTGEPEYQDVSGSTLQLGTSDPIPVGGATAPDPGSGTVAAHDDHQHAVADDSIGLTQLAPAPSASDYGKVLGFDPTTGVAAILDAGQATFVNLTDTPAMFGTEGQAPVVNATVDGLVFAGPYQPLAAPADPGNLHATDAFDGALEMEWDAVTGAMAYEYQRKNNSTPNWPTGTGTQITGTSVRLTSVATLSHDFRVRAVGHGGLLRSSWVEVLNIPVIGTPVPATSSTHMLSRVRSGTLRFSWDNLNVNNGGVGAARVEKVARYEYERQEVGGTWGNVQGVVGQTSAEITGLTDGQLYEARVRAHVQRSDQTMTDVSGIYSSASNQERPVKDTVTLSYGVADTRTGAITSPRTVDLTPGTGSVIEITNAANPATAGQFYALDVDRGPEYAQNYNIISLETRPLPSDITAGADFMAEADVNTGARRYSVGPTIAITATQLWYIEVN